MNSSTKYWYLSDFNFINALDEQTSKRLSDELSMQYFSKGEKIIPKSKYKNHLFILKQGSIKLLDTTSNTVKYVCRNGDLFGHLGFDDENKVNLEVAIALEDCMICFIDVEHMKRLMKESDALKNEVIKVYTLRIQHLERRLSDLTTKDSYTRIKEFILEFIRKYGKENDKEIIVAKNVLSHNDIANLTNTSRQKVSNVLSKLRKECVIDYNSQEFYLKRNQTEKYFKAL